MKEISIQSSELLVIILIFSRNIIIIIISIFILYWILFKKIIILYYNLEALCLSDAKNWNNNSLYYSLSKNIKWSCILYKIYQYINIIHIYYL